LAPDWTGCGHPDPDHSYDGGRTEYDNGKMDGFLQASTGNDTYCTGFYVEKDLPVFSALHRHFTTCDRYFPSIMGPTFPNRIFANAGQTDRLDNSLTFSKLPTIWDNLQTAGVSHKYYYGNVPFLALWGLKYLNICEKFPVFLSDCANDTLPAVSFVDPSLTLVVNTANDDHPFSDMRNGEAFLSQVYQAVSTSPAWDSTVVIFTRDEWGGFFEHVAPPRAVAPNNVDTDLVNGKALLGMRVPAAIVSPWTVGDALSPTVTSEVFDHTSVLKLIESVFGVPPLAARETSTDVGNLLDAINFTRPVRPAPVLPTANPVVPQKLCASSTATNVEIPGAMRVHFESSFQAMIDAGMLDGWPI
jgi:phospholipase C